MPAYPYLCKKCGEQSVLKSMKRSSNIEYCQFCNDPMERIFTVPLITGTRDSFGIGKEWVKDGQVIDNWKSWERAGYIDPKDSPNLTADQKAQIKRKVEKIRKYDTHRKTTIRMGK